MSTQDRPLIDTPTRAETVDELTHRFAAEEVAREMQATAERCGKVLALLIRNATWGWAIVGYPSTRFTVVRAERNDLEPAAIPVLVIRQYLGDPLVLRLTEAELADLGPCPNL